MESLYASYSNTMYAVCLRYTRDRDAASDVLQDSFVKVYRNLKKFEAKGSLEGWIRRIVVNTALDQYRKQSKLHVVDPNEREIGDEMANEALSKLGIEEIMDCIQKLPSGYRTVLNMFVIEGFSHKEISEELEISVGTSKSQLSRAKSMLKEIITSRESGVKMNNYGKG